MLWFEHLQDNVLKHGSIYSVNFIHQLQHCHDSCLVLFMTWTEQDLWQKLHRQRDKEWANSLVWRDRVESFPPQLSEGNICVLANEQCLFSDGAIGSLQPSEVTVSVMVQVKSGDRDGGRSGVIPVSNPAAETERGKSSFLCFSTRPAINVILWITHLPCAFQGSISLLLRKTENWILTFLKWLLAWR